MTTQQVETATVVGTVTGTGNATVTITSRDVTGSPLAVSVAVTIGDTASVVAGLIRTALAFNQYVAAQFLISGTGAEVKLTSHLPRANDSTLNIAIANGTCTGLTAAPTSANTTAGDGLSNAYCLITDVRNADVANMSGTGHDDLLAKVINSVSRRIDLFCARYFYTSTETRYYSPTDNYCLDVDDISTASGITLESDPNGDGTFEDAWTSADYYLGDYNNLLKGFPFTQIEVTPVASFAFPVVRRGVKLTATFGWASIPDPVVTACILQSNRIWQRFKTPLGVAGASAIGTLNMNVPKLDTDVEEMLFPYRRLS